MTDVGQQRSMNPGPLAPTRRGFLGVIAAALAAGNAMQADVGSVAAGDLAAAGALARWWASQPSAGASGPAEVAGVTPGL